MNPESTSPVKSGAKRKRTLSSSQDAAPRKMRMESGSDNGDVTEENAGNDSPIQFPISHQPKWQSTIEKCVKSVVSVRFSQVMAFDTEGPDTSEASGFVVDAELGIILTNRHVVCSGPSVAEAIFHDHEEVSVYPIYRDPIHDFGFLRYEPSKIRHMEVASIPLRPDLARVGLDIRVVGNDAGEKLSILAGSISRLDRNAPDYGDLTYNDFNTFYLQAASSTSGGSSGSPVLDIDGNAVALQAGGHSKAATDFFFPLGRVARALEVLKRNEIPPRGTIQTQFTYRPFDEVRRLGTSDATEALVRSLFPKEVGMLVVETVLPEGPGAGKIEEGDVLTAVNGRVITKFEDLEALFDDNVGREIKVKIERGGDEVEQTILVQNLHSITPNRLVEIGGGKVNDLSYQLARQYCVPVRGCYVCDPAGMLRLDGPDNGWIVTSVDGKPTPNLDALIEAFQAIPDRERIPITFYSIADVHSQSVSVVTVERHWTGFREWRRNDTTGLWIPKSLGEAIPAKPLEPRTATFAFPEDVVGPTKELLRSLVRLSYYMPVRLDGFPRSRKTGAGLIVDAKNGIVVVGRNVVPFALGDISITVADSVVIPGKVLFIHPTHNFSIVKYDPRHLGETPVLAAPISNSELKQGQHVNLVAFNHNHRPIFVETTVTDISTVTIPQSSSPRFRSTNFDAITLDTPLAQQCGSGVLADAAGNVQGLWLSYMGERTQNGQDNEYHLGLSISAVKELIPFFSRGEIPIIRGLAMEVTPLQLSQARHMGLTDEWVQRVEEANAQRRQVYLVRRSQTGSPTASALQELDIMLEIEGKTVTRTSELDVKPNTQRESLQVSVVRQKDIMKFSVPTTIQDTVGTNRVVFWAGAVLHRPHTAVLQQSKHLPSEIYVSGRSKGSPAYMFGLQPTTWITGINGKKVKTLDEFVAVVKELQDNTYIRVKTMSFDQVPVVLSIKMNFHYHPSAEWIKDDREDCGWRKISLNKADDDGTMNSTGIDLV